MNDHVNDGTEGHAEHITPEMWNAFHDRLFGFTVEYRDEVPGLGTIQISGRKLSHWISVPNEIYYSSSGDEVRMSIWEDGECHEVAVGDPRIVAKAALLYRYVTDLFDSWETVGEARRQEIIIEARAAAALGAGGSRKPAIGPYRAVLFGVTDVVPPRPRQPEPDAKPDH